MEFPDLGKHCSFHTCLELDFLPLICTHCQLIFCKNHISPESHECKLIKSEKYDVTCVSTFKCVFDGCNDSSAVEMTCPRCQNHFCLQHRYHSCFEHSKEEVDAKKKIWDASKIHHNQALNEVNQIVNEAITKSMQKPKRQETAQKINLMRLKAKAQGPKNIPQDDRLYFMIAYKKDECNHVFKPVFTSKEWSVGRMIDSVADICSLPNRNNVSNARKLRLFKKLNGVQISNEMGVKIDSLIKESKIFDGETLILEFVNPHEDLSNFKLLNYDEYRDS